MKCEAPEGAHIRGENDPGREGLWKSDTLWRFLPAPRHRYLSIFVEGFIETCLCLALALPCLTLPYLVLPCLALPCLALPLFSSLLSSSLLSSLRRDPATSSCKESRTSPGLVGSPLSCSPPVVCMEAVAFPGYPCSRRGKEGVFSGQPSLRRRSIAPFSSPTSHD
jgi:hypothetical protein